MVQEGRKSKERCTSKNAMGANIAPIGRGRIQRAAIAAARESRRIMAGTRRRHDPARTPAKLPERHPLLLVAGELEGMQRERVRLKDRRYRRFQAGVRAPSPDRRPKMYGMVNNAIKEMILAEHGDRVWRMVKEQAGVTHEVFLSNEPYPDSVTYGLIQSASSILAVPSADVLHRLGIWWILKTGREGYGHLMQSGGGNLREFLRNLPNFHTRIMMMFPDLNPPEFECEEVGPDAMRLHYRSSRQGLAPFVGGLLQGLSEMFATPIAVTHELSAGSGADHDVFLVNWK
jgi:hypothetical protein